MTYYLGPAGQLVALPAPEAGLTMSLERVGGMHQLLSGARVRDTLGTMRTWPMVWSTLDVTTYGTLETFAYAAIGAGPYYFLDPEQRNLLDANVAAGTDATGDTTGFTPMIGSAGLFSSTSGSGFVTGSHALGALFAPGVTAFQEIWQVTRSPVVIPALGYTLSGYLTVDASSPAHFFIGIHWMDSSGTQISSVASNEIAGGGAGRVTATGTAPTGAVYGRISMQCTAANSGGTTYHVYADGLQFEQASAVSTWVPGSGVPLVTIDSLSRSTPLAGVCDAQMTLVQVG